MIGSYLIGLPYGPQGVALAYSTGMMLWVLPLIVWAVHDTVVSVRDILMAVARPLSASLLAAALAFGFRYLYGQFLPPLIRLVLEATVLLFAFAGILLFVTGQRSLYLDVLKGLRKPPATPPLPQLEKSEAS